MAYSVNSVEFPSGLQMRESVRIDVLVDSQGNLDEKIHNHETLGTNLEWQDFDSVGDEQTRPSKSVGDGEDPDHSDDGLACSLAVLGLLLGRANRPDDEGNTHRGGSSNEKRTATNSVSYLVIILSIR